MIQFQWNKNENSMFSSACSCETVDKYFKTDILVTAWDNEDFVKAVKATGRKQLIMALTIAYNTGK